PLYNSLTHLTYVTSASPTAIREIMTMITGLGRLALILHNFCMFPLPPVNAAVPYYIFPPNSRSPKPVPTQNPKSYSRHVPLVTRSSLPFQPVHDVDICG
ncbi:hypothetical protein BV25DRAFT_1780561, partial [Artomyces pyxidatus]